MSSNRPVGAPRGNRNALKHGFYSTLPAQETPEEAGSLDLSAEIALLRLQIRKVVELSSGDEDLDSARETLRLLCLSSTAISRLVRAQFLVHGSPDETIAEIIGRIAEQTRQELAGEVPPGYYASRPSDAEQSEPPASEHSERSEPIEHSDRSDPIEPPEPAPCPAGQSLAPSTDPGEPSQAAIKPPRRPRLAPDPFGDSFSLSPDPFHYPPERSRRAAPPAPNPPWLSSKKEIHHREHREEN